MHLHFDPPQQWWKSQQLFLWNEIALKQHSQPLIALMQRCVRAPPPPTNKNKTNKKKKNVVYNTWHIACHLMYALLQACSRFVFLLFFCFLLSKWRIKLSSPWEFCQTRKPFLSSRACVETLHAFLGHSINYVNSFCVAVSPDTGVCSVCTTLLKLLNGFLGVCDTTPSAHPRPPYVPFFSGSFWVQLFFLEWLYSYHFDHIIPHTSPTSLWSSGRSSLVVPWAHQKLLCSFLVREKNNLLSAHCIIWVSPCGIVQRGSRPSLFSSPLIHI